MPDNDLEYYRLRAAKARQLAAAAQDPLIKRIHDRMASDYESLASGHAEPAARKTWIE